MPRSRHKFFFLHLSVLLASNALPQLIRQESNFHYIFFFIYSHFSLHMHTIAHSSFKQSISMQKMVVRINSVISSGGSMLLCFFIFIIVVMFFFIRLHIVFFSEQFFFSAFTLNACSVTPQLVISFYIFVAIFRLFNTMFDETTG